MPISSQESTITSHILRIVRMSNKPKATVAPFVSQESKEPDIVHVQVGPKSKCAPKRKRPARKPRHL